MRRSRDGHWVGVLILKRTKYDINPSSVGHCGLVTQYGDTKVGQYWLRQLLVAWWHQSICSDQFPWEVLKISIHKMSFEKCTCKIIFTFSRANDLTYSGDKQPRYQSVNNPCFQVSLTNNNFEYVCVEFAFYSKWPMRYRDISRLLIWESRFWDF